MKKAFGQHLLIDSNYLLKIIDAVNLKNDDRILEIGSGTGVVTCELAKKAKNIIAVEPERIVLLKLKQNLEINKLNNVRVIEKSFLKLDLNDILNNSKKCKIIGNIPYNLTSKILLKLFGEIDEPAKHLKNIDSIYLMLQNEVAERIVSGPDSKAYSPLTILVQYFARPEILFKVPSDAFQPKPKVNSAFVKFSIKEKVKAIRDPALLKNIVRVSFQQRRKKVINALEKLFGDKERIRKVFDKLHLDYNLRAENLNFENYLAISNTI